MQSNIFCVIIGVLLANLDLKTLHLVLQPGRARTASHLTKKLQKRRMSQKAHSAIVQFKPELG